MVEMYVKLIQADKKTIDDVPAKYKAEVEKRL